MWIINRLRQEFQFIKSLIINERKIMTDQEYQAGMTAAIVAYQASVSYPVSGFSYTYTPSVVTPPAETVSVSL
jgi:hypothetical protein